MLWKCKQWFFVCAKWYIKVFINAGWPNQNFVAFLYLFGLSLNLCVHKIFHFFILLKANWFFFCYFNRVQRLNLDRSESAVQVMTIGLFILFAAAFFFQSKGFSIKKELLRSYISHKNKIKEKQFSFLKFSKWNVFLIGILQHPLFLS